MDFKLPTGPGAPRWSLPTGEGTAVAGPTTLSNTYNYSPNLGALTIYAYQCAGIRPTALVQEHMDSARMAANMICARWSNQGVNLWQVDLQTVPLVQGQASYSVPNNTVVMLDAYVQITNGASQPIDRIILPVSRSEYAAYSNKTQQGQITTFWFDRLLNPSVTLYLTPDGTSASTLNYYRLIQLMDANLAGGQQPDVPYLFLEAFADALAYRLAKIWAPDKAQALKGIADESYNIAAAQNIETAAFYISPSTGNYFRN